MKDVKFRFVNRIKKTGEIKFVYTSINELEMEDSWQGEVYYERLGINLSTGLLDKNGKEIYEGDVLGRQVGSSGVVSFEQQACQFWVKWKEGKSNRYCPLIAHYGDEDGHSTSYWEVIGNIYTSPELIK